MKILFLHPNKQDYLADGLFHGLRELIGDRCVDFPRHDCMYKPLTANMRSKLRGNGFTLYGLLEDISHLQEERYNWEKSLNEYDLVIVSNIWNQWRIVKQLNDSKLVKKLIVLDGSDYPPLFPFAYHLRNNPEAYFFDYKSILYFKRELYDEGEYYRLESILPRPLRKKIRSPESVHGLAFSIPSEKVDGRRIYQKIKDFPEHIVDQEIASKIDESFYSGTGSDKLIFTNENDYYSDLSQTRFGITTKRAGWDCLRHYELAANGCTICFRDLDKKPYSCAPHNLNSANSICYSSYVELEEKIKKLNDIELNKLSENAVSWAQTNTTEARALEFLAKCGIDL